jgi:hypothetical protein
LLTAGGVSGLGIAGVMNIANPDSVSQLGLPSIISAGIVSEVVGDKLWTMVKK